jgi:CRISPR type III-B/RAMP module RAMP protein Cmr1
MKIPIRFITPCFCAGANQLAAEIRPSAFRGELRWWFRCIGGTSEQENLVFGGTADKNPRASTLLIRVSEIKLSDSPYTPSFTSPGQPEAYHNYYLNVLNENGQTRMWRTPPDDRAKKKGEIRAESQIAPGSTCMLTILKNRRLQPDVDGLLDLAIELMLLFGSIGYRKSRGFGVWSADDYLSTKADLESKFAALVDRGFSYKFATNSNNDSMAVFRQIEGQLKGDKICNTGLRLHHKAINKSPLGFSLGRNERQASAVYFRPCATKTKTGGIQYSLLTFQAPDLVLGDSVKRAYPPENRRII